MQDDLCILDPHQVELLSEATRASLQAGVQVVWVVSPYWLPDPETGPLRQQAIDQIAEQADREGVPCLLFTQQTRPEFLDPALFADELHLNATGAGLFTSMLAEWLVQQGYAKRRVEPRASPVADQSESSAEEALSSLLPKPTAPTPGPTTPAW
jgi:hypothetical protein